MVARCVGCSYEDTVANLGDRYGQLATVAAASTEKLTVGQNWEIENSMVYAILRN